MRLTMPHMVDFGDDANVVGAQLLTPEAWDALRVETSGPYAIAGARATLEAELGKRPDLVARAELVLRWMDDNGLRSIASYGVGAAILEFAIHRADPSRRLVVSDFAPQTVARLRELLPEVEVARHDLARDVPPDADVHLFHRIDTEFDDDGWRGVFRRFDRQRVLVVPAGVVGYRQAFHAMRPRLRGRGATHAGWLRTASSLEALWSATHVHARLRFDGVRAWDLVPLDVSA